MRKRWAIISELMHLGGYRITRWLTSAHPRVLMYHRVLPGDKTEGALAPEIFRWQLAMLATHFNVQPLDALIESHQKGRMAPYSVAITFDDGYSDFNEFALPELKAAGLPATLFVTTGFVDGTQWMWPDMLKWALGNTSLTEWMAPNGRHFRLPLEKLGAWHAAADQALALSNEDRYGFIKACCASLGVQVPVKPAGVYAPLTWQDLRAMPADLISVGSHTVTHPIMSRLAPDLVEQELVLSKRHIEEQLDREVTGFCYPNGMRADVSPSVAAAVSKAGYRYACVAYPGRHPFQDVMAINRYATSNDTDGFLKVLFGARYFRL